MTQAQSLEKSIFGFVSKLFSLRGARLDAIDLIASPELKKEEWSVYVLDQSASERKFSGNGTITSVLQEDEPVPIIGKVKNKFRKEMLDIELQLVKVLLPWIFEVIVGANLSSEETDDIVIGTITRKRVTTTFPPPHRTRRIPSPPHTSVPSTHSTTKHSPRIIFFPSLHRPIMDRL